jgi:hypothetical protein
MSFCRSPELELTLRFERRPDCHMPPRYLRRQVAVVSVAQPPELQLSASAE